MKRGENSPFFSPSPILPVQIPIADGFGQVSGEYLFAAFQIGNGARYFLYAVVGAGGEVEPVHGIF